MNKQSPNLTIKESWHFTKTKFTYFTSIILIAIFYTSCSKSPVTPAPIPNYEGIYLGDIYQNGPNGFNNYKHEYIYFKVFDNKLQPNIDFTSIFSSSIDSKIVRINLSGSSFNIKPDTSTIENSVNRIITGSGSFKNYELTVEWKEKHIHTNGRIDTSNFKGTLKR